MINKESELRRAIVTTGGTKEQIDDVRFITNFSTGKFGYSIANALAEEGFAVTVLSPKEVPTLAGYTIEGANHMSFTDTESLRRSLLTQDTPHVIFHAAAVSDFRPKRVVDGKISSKQETLVIELERTPKILSELREHYGNTVFLVGFKLLSGVRRQELIDAALEQNRKNHLNLTVANDLKDLNGGMHPITLVTAEGGAINVVGKGSEVARNLVEFVKKRSTVTWYHTEQVTNLPDIPLKEKEKFAELLKFAQDTNLLYDSSGNVSMRHEGLMLVTPRQVDKSKTTPEEVVTALVDHESNSVYYQGRIKSSIDTGVSDAIYRKFPNIKYLLHFHTPWGKSSSETSFPYPCGVKEEAEEIFRQLNNKTDGREFAVELLHHGFLVGLPEGGVKRLKDEWIENVKEFRRHLVDVRREDKFTEMVLKPIFSDTKIIGVFAENNEGGVVYLSQYARGSGVGRKIVEQLIQRQKPIQTIDECGVVDFYNKFGFKGEKNPDTGIYTFYPPKVTDSDPLFRRIDEWRVR